MITKDTRNKLIEKLILHEGMKLKVYDDANGKEIRAGDTLVGHPTIGVGRNVAGDGLGITEEEAKILLSNDVDRVLREVNHWAFMDNMGCSRFNEQAWPKFFKAVMTGNYKEASKQMLDSKWAGQVKTRANILAKMMETGKWS